MKQLYFKNISDWSNWLDNNHAIENEICLVFNKNDSKIESLIYKEALQFTLCCGWIDSIIKRIDDKRYLRKINKRSEKSKWSEANKKIIEELTQNGKMKEAGLKSVEVAKKNGTWDKPDKPQIKIEMPIEFETALKKNPASNEFFLKLAKSYQKQYIIWIAMAKKNETRKRRIKEAIILLKQKKKLGLK